MAEWNEPKTDYKASDQVTPSCFNVLGEDAKYLKESSCQVLKRPTTGSDVKIVTIVLVETA